MTRYLCVDPSHTLGGEPAAIDLTAQVRLEREFLPRESAYLADSGDVIRRVNDLGEVDGALRAAAVRRILTGTTTPLDAPVVLVAGDRTERVPGLYEMDELRRSERSVASLLDRYAQTSLAREGSEDLVVLRDQQPPLRPDGSTVQPGQGSTVQSGPTSPMVETVSIPEVRSDEAIVLPQGVYPVLELATRLAEADVETDSLVDVIHATPSYGSLATEESRRPWRVIVECPVATGEPLTRHQMIFTGTGETEPVEVLGTPAVGNDVVLDRAASKEAVMPFPARRAERGLQIALLAAAVIAAAVLIITWISGGLALAVRETPVWLGLSVTLGVAAMAVGLVALASRSDAEGNTNDTFVLRRHYASRIDMLWYATLATAVLFSLSVAAGVIPPILASETPVPSAAITFDAGRALVTATVQVQTQGLATDQPVTVQMRQYAQRDEQRHPHRPRHLHRRSLRGHGDRGDGLARSRGSLHERAGHHGQRSGDDVHTARSRGPRMHRGVGAAAGRGHRPVGAGHLSARCDRGDGADHESGGADADDLGDPDPVRIGADLSRADDVPEPVALAVLAGPRIR